jgi:ubiquinone/menaquinone biosynthesis C-methylase UbiE
MRPIRDPEKAEFNHLVSACSLKNKTVLEIGCGDGTFTRQYVRLADKVLGIDPAMVDLAIAKKKTRSNKANFIQCEGERLPFLSRTFDIVLFASSL